MAAQADRVEFGDMQGIFRFGHGHLEAARFLLLRIIDNRLAAEWLARAPVTSAEKSKPPPDTALQVAFSAAGLSHLGVPAEIMAGFSEPFVGGMTADNRSRRLGDADGSAPPLWHWGGNHETTPHLLLMLYARPDRLDAFERELRGREFERAFSELPPLETNGDLRREPFGFLDGISQPELDWANSQPVDSHRRSRYSNLLAPGEVVLGYPNEYDEYTDRPLLHRSLDPHDRLPSAGDQPALKDLGRNGGYLVMRQLEQDVPGFWRFVHEAAGNDATRREQLAAAMVGRRRDGQPLVEDTSADGNSATRDGGPIPGHDNRFNFDADPLGRICPLGAHIRRANPRTGDRPPTRGGLFIRALQVFGLHAPSRRRDLVASTRFHRLLRRGRAYGPALDPEQALSATTPVADSEPRGIHFIALCANIGRQFEFVQSAWIANAKFAGLRDETDPLLGNRKPLLDGTPTDGFSRPQASGPCEYVAGLPVFVRVRGGGYFFVPGLRALRFIADIARTPLPAETDR